MKPVIKLLFVVLVMCTVASPAWAQSKDELKDRFMAREPELRAQKEKNTIGETVEGYVAIADENKADRKVAALVDDENKDRKRLFQILADEINKEEPNAKVKATAELMGRRNAQRNIERAGSDELLRVAKDHWIRIRDFPRFEKLFKLKTQDKVGETSDGTIEIVKAEDRNDKTMVNLVDEENKVRAEEYKKLAKDEKVDVSVIVKRMAKRNFENARIGDMLKENGNWRKK